MGLLSCRVERSEIKAGDHIYTWRALYTYSHHGIYVGGEKVVHFTRKKDSTSSVDSSSSSSSSSSAECLSCVPDCGFEQPGGGGVMLSCLDCFLCGGSLRRFEYGVAAHEFLAKVRGGTCTTAPGDAPSSVVRRAMYLLRNGFGRYDLFENNCEDFALYCKTGLLPVEEQGRSGQALSAVGIPLAALLSTPFKLLMAGPLGMATVAAGMYCAGRYVTDIGVRRDMVKLDVEDLAALNLGWKQSSSSTTL